MTPLRLVGCLFAVLLSGSCAVVDPLVAADDYAVQAEGGTTIQVRFAGGSGVSRLRQRDVIQDSMLDLSKDPQRVSAAFDAMLELEALFEADGFPLVRVDHRVDEQGPEPVVRFEIDQGPQVVVEELQLRGSEAFDSETLLAYWSRRSGDALGFGRDLYVGADLAALASAIEAHYARAGYLDCRASLQDPEPPLAADVRRVRVAIDVQEGQRYTIGEVVVAPEIRAALDETAPATPAPDGPFVASEIRGYSLELRAFLRSRGHIDPKLSLAMTPDTQARRVDVKIEGDPGPVFAVREIHVDGENFVAEAAIRARISVEEGARFDGREEEASLLRLYQSGLFTRVEMTHETVSPGVVDLQVRVEETTRYLVQPLVGWGSYEELRGGLEFEMLRFLGTSYDLNTSGVISQKGYRGVATLSDSRFMPWLFGEGMTFSLSGDAFERKEPSFTDGAVGFSPALSKSFTTRLSARVAYVFREHGAAESDVIDPGAQIGRYTEGAALAELSWDLRDNPLMPKTGSRLSLQYKTYDESLGSDIELQKLRAIVTTVHPVTRTMRVALRAEAAALFPGGGSDAVPIQERYFNGGESTVRSYREDQLAPAYLRDVNGLPIGGEYMTVGSAELRWAPGLRLFNTADIEFTLFADAGNLGRPGDDLGFDRLRYAIGAGVRALLPIGPLRFDFGHNPSAAGDERDWTFHFSIGYPF